ncbi:MAG: hypothetical protein K0S76_402 [Herbinix sp.]|nr:hypothetical protein [Herbinix sp.]
MTIRFRNYRDEEFGDDYKKVRTFLLKLNYPGFSFGRWDWMVTHSYLEKNSLGRIGLWEDDAEIIAAALFDTTLGGAFCYAFEEYAYLKKELLEYAESNLGKNGQFKIMINDTDTYFQEIAAQSGFIALSEKDSDGVYLIDLAKIHYNLPEGFHITSLKDTFDLYQYGQVLWKGFNHEIDGEGAYTFSSEKEQVFFKEMIRPNVNLDLKIAVVAPNGDFVSYCGMWFDSDSDFALVEPVATDPAYRKLGLGKAAVLEGIRRCGALGAKRAFVGSSQQFYYSIGFRPYATSSWWMRK